MMTRNNTKLHIENFPLRHSGDSVYTEAIPNEFLASLKLANPSPPLSAELTSLKRLILQSENLNVFHYKDRGQGTRFNFEDDERMPAFKDLHLTCYDWNHSADEVRKHWDFSQLRCLAIRTMPSHNFLNSVPLHQFSQLRSLQVEDWSAHLPDKRAQATQLLHELVGTHCKRLERLEITCHTQSFGMEAIIMHRDTLRKLSFRDHVGFRNESRRCPTVDPRDLAKLAQSLQVLQSIELDMDVQSLRDPFQFLTSLLDFPTLDEITLHIQTTIPTHGEYVPQIDRDHRAAASIFSTLLDGREINQPDRPLKKITITVGGWQPVMVRRLGANWRELNEQGIFAERCFVLERIEGQNMVQELACVESSSSRATPER